MYCSNGYKEVSPNRWGKPGGGGKLLALLAMSVIMGIPFVGYSLPDDSQFWETVQNTIKVTGKVTDAAGEALIGVAVLVKGEAGNAATTDVDGVYNIEAPGDGVLEFTFIGMKKEEIPVNGRGVIDVASMALRPFQGEPAAWAGVPWKVTQVGASAIFL